MPAHRVLKDIDQARGMNVLTLTATTTLTAAQLLTYGVINIASYATTLPAASAGLAGRTVRLYNSSTAANVTCSEGFGANTTSSDVYSLAQGEFLDIYCDERGADWYSSNAAS